MIAFFAGLVVGVGVMAFLVRGAEIHGERQLYVARGLFSDALTRSHEAHKQTLARLAVKNRIIKRLRRNADRLRSIACAAALESEQRHQRARALVEAHANQNPRNGAQEERVAAARAILREL